MNIKNYLDAVANDNHLDSESLQIPNYDIEPKKIKVIMISEVPPQNPDDNFYSNAPQPNYMKSTVGLFEKANVNVKSIQDILNSGIYITTAVKTPKTEYTITTDVIKSHLPILKAELAVFPHLKVIMLMGDVAKKALNMIAKAETKKNVIPSESTYKIRHNEYYWKNIRLLAKLK